ncbi:MAG: lectin-like protein [Planctomycetota bacterium]
MARRFVLPAVLLVLLLGVPASAPADTLSANPAVADPIAEAVREAEQAFHLGIMRAKNDRNKSITTILDREIERAIATGDLDTLESLQAQLEAYQTDETLPELPATRSHTTRYDQQLIRLGNDLIKAYETATRQYTQARDVENARLIKEKILWTRPTHDLKTHRHSNHLYMVVHEQKTWRQAKAEAEALGGYLACISDRSEVRFIVRNVTKGKTNAWLGGTDAHQEGDWVWLNGEEGYWPWNKNEPNNVRRKQHHAVLNLSGSLSDINENDTRVKGYLVEWDALPTRETIYKTPAQAERDAEAIDTLKSATLTHNARIVAERERLQSAIVEAQDEATIEQARKQYDDRVLRIKIVYLEQLNTGLERALAEDSIEITTSIQTQRLRVQGQLAKFTDQRKRGGISIPAPDAGDADPTPADEPDAPVLADDRPDEAPDPAEPEAGPDDAGTFFGLPLE